MEPVIKERAFPARVEDIPQVLDFITDAAGLAGLHPKRIIHMQLAVEEAVANICSYAYEVPPGELLVQINGDKKHFVLKLVDRGIPFDPLALKEPDLKAGIAERQVGGLGVLLIRRIMDEVHYKREGSWNILTMVVNKEQAID